MQTLLSDWIFDSPLVYAGWRDVLDIALLSWVIYRAYLVLRGTRAMQSLLGIGLLAVIYLLSDSRGLGLNTLHWVLSSLFVYLVLAMFILFQDDIRNGLAQAGGSLFSRGVSRASATVVEELTRAVFLLAAKKTGAIIVIERLANLDTHVEGAHRLDARVSTELIQALFQTKSPLHDGAIVVRGERILAASVFLPLTRKEKVSLAFGTRHRAGIGLTERTDALCLVVSEERGTVSLVEAGEVIPVVDSNDLRQRLQAKLELDGRPE